MIFPLFLLTGACALGQMHAIESSFPKEERVQIASLPNGVMTFVQENNTSQNEASFRVVWKKSLQEQELHALDASLDNLEPIERFFHHCREIVRHSNTVPLGCFPCDPTSFPHSENIGIAGENIAVIAVGNFPTVPMQELIHHFFADLRFTKENQMTRVPIEIGLSHAKSDVALRIDYTPQKIHDSLDLKEEWKQILLQELFQQRMERCTRSLDESWSHPRPRFLYPVHGHVLSEREDFQNVFSYLLWEIEQIRTEGYSEQEFIETKRKILHKLQYLASQAQSHSHNATLASYYTDQFIRGQEHLPYEAFITLSQDLLATIRLPELMEELSDFLSDENRSIQILYPSYPEKGAMTIDDVESLIQKVSSLSHFEADSDFPEEGILLLNNSAQPPILRANIQRGMLDARPILSVSNSSTDPFYQLPLSDTEKRNISYIITNMADKNVVQLLFKKGDLEKKGKKINPVHPMRFMGYILSTPNLKKCVYQIEKSSFKWDAFIEGFANRMKEEGKHDNVTRHIPGFAHQLGVPPEQVTYFIHKKDWEGLVRFLMST